MHQDSSILLKNSLNLYPRAPVVRLVIFIIDVHIALSNNLDKLAPHHMYFTAINHYNFSTIIFRNIRIEKIEKVIVYSFFLLCNLCSETNMGDRYFERTNNMKLEQRDIP